MKTQKNSVRRSLILSATALMISVAMLIGTTFAWFTDSVSSGKNKIVAGNLDVELTYKNGDTWKTVDQNTNVFKDDTLWEPGHVEYAVLKITNAGTLALQYKLGVNVTNETTGISVKNDTEFKLSDYLQSAVVDGDISSNTRADVVTAAKAAAGAGKLSAGYTTTNHLLATPDNNEKTVTLVVWMPEDVGNEANYKKGSTVPTIDLGISLVATQYEHEEDSFGNTYDASADGTPDNGAQWDGTAVSKTTVTDNSDNTKTVTMTIGNENETGYTVATVKGEASAIAADGDPANLNLVITKTGTPKVEIKDDTEEVEALDIKVENKAADAVVTVTRNIGTGKKNVKVYHDKTLMTEVSGDQNLNDGQYSYDSDTGVLKIVSSSFSPFDIVWDKNLITSQDDLNAAINAGQTDIKLGKGTFTLYNQKGVNAENKQELTFTGAGADKTIFEMGYTETGSERGDYSFRNSNVSFNNMTIQTLKNGDYTGIIYATGLSFDNCVISGRMSYWGTGTSTFTNCEFADNGNYNLWLYSGTDVTFTNCTFKSSTGNFVNAYVEKKTQDVRNLTFDNCQFIGGETQKYAAVCLKRWQEQNWNLVMNNCTVKDVATNNETQSSLYQFSDKKDEKPRLTDTTVTIDNKIVWQNGALVTDTSSAS